MELFGWTVDDVVRPDARVCQGDLIRFSSPEDPLRALAIVVTADCDLANRKHSRLLTVVPVLSARKIIEHYLIPEHCDRVRADLNRFVSAALNVSAETADVVRDALFREVVESPDKYSSGVACAAGYLLDEIKHFSIITYVSLMNEVKLKAKSAGAFKDQLRSKGDLFILPDAPALGLSGSVAWVRPLWQISVSDVALRTSEVSSRRAERIARLASPFRYRLTQVMARVFSDIGLPSFIDTIDNAIDEDE